MVAHPPAEGHPPEPAPDPDAPAAGTRLSAAEIHENVLEAGEEEMRRPASNLAWSALTAGLTIGFSLVASAYLSTLVDEPLREAAAAMGYPLGFVFVVLARNQLFTENTLEPVIPLLHRRDRETLRLVLRLWGIVLAGNLVGALAFGIVAARTPVFDETLHAAMLRVSVHATEGGFWLVAWRAVFGGWMIALMAWLIASTRYTGAQVLLVWLATAPISAFGFRHSIAGAVEAFYRAAAGDAAWATMLGEFLVPALLGNIVGGVVLVALLNHGQVAESKGRWPRIRR